MMKFDVKNRFSGDVQFTAKIDCTEVDATSKKLGLAVKWAYLTGANLEGADLTRADLTWAYLTGANLTRADLRWSNLEGANLTGATLARANLARANLAGVYLKRADLGWATLEGVDLTGVNLEGANGINGWVKCIQIETYAITYTADVLQIGCEQHPIADWRNFDALRIAEMDGRPALKFWDKYKDWIFQAIELCPAKPTGVKQ